MVRKSYMHQTLFLSFKLANSTELSALMFVIKCLTLFNYSFFPRGCKFTTAKAQWCTADQNVKYNTFMFCLKASPSSPHVDSDWVCFISTG